MRRRTRSLRRGHCSRMPRDPRGRYGSAARALRLPRPLRAACRPRARRSPSSAVARAAGSPPPLLPPPRQPPRSPAGRARTAPWARTGAPDEAANQTQSDAIRGHQTQSDSHRRTARSSSGAVPGGIAQVDGRWNWTVKRTCGEWRGAVVSTCMLEHLHDGRWNWTVKRTSKPRRNQTQSDAIRRTRTQSDTIRRNQTHSDALRLAQAHLETTSQSDAIRRNQTHSDAIRLAQAHLETTSHGKFPVVPHGAELGACTRREAVHEPQPLAACIAHLWGRARRRVERLHAGALAWRSCRAQQRHSRTCSATPRSCRPQAVQSPRVGDP